MKSKIILGLATLASLAIPSFAQQTYCRLDGDGDRQICTTSGYDAYGRYYEQNFSRPVNNGYYNYGYDGYYGNGGYYNNYGYDQNRHYRQYDRDYRRREHEEHERREHERHEWREHDHDRDDYDR